MFWRNLLPVSSGWRQTVLPKCWGIMTKHHFWGDIILSRPSGSVTIKRREFWISYWIYWTLTILDNTLQSSAIAIVHSLSAVHYSTHLVFLVCCPSPVLWYWLQPWTFLFQGSQTVPVPQPQQVLTHSALTQQLQSVICLLSSIPL
jgi:hypothetical protein